MHTGGGEHSSGEHSEKGEENLNPKPYLVRLQAGPGLRQALAEAQQDGGRLHAIRGHHT